MSAAKNKKLPKLPKHQELPKDVIQILQDYQELQEKYDMIQTELSTLLSDITAIANNEKTFDDIRDKSRETFRYKYATRIDKLLGRTNCVEITDEKEDD